MIFMFLFILSCVLPTSVVQGNHNLANNHINNNQNEDHFDCKQLRWVHIPKTGSSFCLTLQHLCCQTQFENLTQDITMEMLIDNELIEPNHRTFGVELAYGCARFHRGKETTCQVGGPHTPLQLSESSQNRQYVGFFRDPQRRVISSFLDSVHHEGMPPEDFIALQHQLNNISNSHQSSLKRLVAKAQLYASHPDVIGCQVKMLNGYECSSPLFKNQPFNHTAMEVAIKRLQEFYFIGLTEHFGKSVELFHVMMKRGTVPYPVELYAARTSRKDYTEILRRHLAVEDPYDSLLYMEAKNIFEARLKIYGLSS
eukprot:gene5029-5519_t